MTFKQWQRDNYVPKTQESEWRIFCDYSQFRAWMDAMTHQHVNVVVLERIDTPVCIRARVAYC